MSAVLAGGLAVAALVVLGGAAPAQAATKYQFDTFDNPADPNFNQLLGINNLDDIVGYDGDGSVEPNKGYLLVPKDHYANENFPKSAQTQVIGISNNDPNSGFSRSFPITVGFWVDGKGNNFGFVNQYGTFTSVADPHAAASGGVKTDQLLGVNSGHLAVGFYNDAKGNSHGYIYEIEKNTFTAITLPFSGVQSFQATGINNTNVICGFWVDGKGKSHGFLGTQGHFKSVDAPSSTSTAFFGINNKDMLVGAVTRGGVSHGLLYDSKNGTSTIVDDPDQSSKAAFGVTGTFINGINDYNEIVGFYSDGKKVHGFFATP